LAGGSGDHERAWLGPHIELSDQPANRRIGRALQAEKHTERHQLVECSGRLIIDSISRSTK
jgi:hypothetical protein